MSLLLSHDLHVSVCYVLFNEYSILNTGTCMGVPAMDILDVIGREQHVVMWSLDISYYIISVMYSAPDTTWT